MTSDDAAEDPKAERTGGCLCGAVRYQVTGAMRPVVLCHCGQCRRTHGHVAAYSSVLWQQVTLLEERGLKWFPSSDIARRGFCQDCGASLFWEPRGEGRIDIAAGSLDLPSGLSTVGQIFVEDAGDYYKVDDNLPIGHG